MAQGSGRQQLTIDPEDPIVAKTALSTLARRHAIYSDEVHRLLDAGLELMRRHGTTTSPRVSDIVEAAGCHREAFYRHFSSKDDLVAAIVEAGANRLVSYLEHQMGKAADPKEQLRRWVEGIMAQARNPEVADATRAVIWNGNRIQQRSDGGSSRRALAELIVPSLTALGSADPVRDAAVVAEAVMGRMQSFLWQRLVPSEADVEHLVGFCLGVPARNGA